ncbi:MAG TPA: YeeE/YedE thiosulfate transporter family protein [Candidatus Limnocylindrales bacterium]|nr:YeeE/YedE thiosulfate transporter family protein [Candidatus Limnocylindrales bacterium]
MSEITTEMSAPQATPAVSARKSSRRTETRKTKKDQTIYGVAILGLTIVFGIYLTTVSATLGIFWLTGIAFGFILRRSNFCFTASMRDPIMTGSTTLTRAVLIALGITSIGFAALQYSASFFGLPIPGMGFVVPISFATVAGAVLFGTGMVLAGGCASGTLMRIGEGYGMQLLSIVFFVIGSFWAARDMGWWTLNFISNGPRIHLPEILSWGGAITVQLIVIASLYFLALKWENRKQES